MRFLGYNPLAKNRGNYQTSTNNGPQDLLSSVLGSSQTTPSDKNLQQLLSTILTNQS